MLSRQGRLLERTICARSVVMIRDFVIRSDWSGWWTGSSADGRGAQMITLMGIESPGLTSSLAIGEMVVEEVLKTR